MYIGRSADTLFFGTDERGPVRVPASAVTQLEVSRGMSRLRGSLRGALWGGAVMAGLGALVMNDPAFDTGGVSSGEFIVASAVQGAVLGAIIGAFVPARVWTAADPRILLQAAGTGSGVGARLGLAF